jgi:VanZ family protein
MSLNHLFRCFGLLAVVLLGLLSLVPGTTRPHTGLPGQGEHYMAYLLTGLVLCLGFTVPKQRMGIALMLCIFAGLMEILQNLVPGRTPQMIDFVASSLGALSGILLCLVILNLSPPLARALLPPK